MTLTHYKSITKLAEMSTKSFGVNEQIKKRDGIAENRQSVCVKTPAERAASVP